MMEGPYIRAVSKNPNLAARSASDVVKLISMELAESTEKLSFLKVIEVEKFSRPKRRMWKESRWLALGSYTASQGL